MTREHTHDRLRIVALTRMASGEWQVTRRCPSCGQTWHSVEDDRPTEDERE